MTDALSKTIQADENGEIRLSPAEKQRLKECEEVIKKGLGTFLEVGQALAEIRDNRLYREQYKGYTFKRYCREVWDLGESTAYKKINGYQAVKLLKSKNSTIVEFLKTDSDSTQIPLPVNEAQARKLAKLKDPDEQVKAWCEVLKHLNENPKARLTAALVNRAVKKVRGGAAKRRVDTTKKEIDRTNLVSALFKRQYQVMLDILSEERNNGWKTCKQTEVVRWLKTMIKEIEEED